MATCAACTLDIPDAATRCPHCTTKVRGPGDGMSYGALWVLGALLVITIVIIMLSVAGDLAGGT